jgi:site-specific DNA recombinase
MNQKNCGLYLRVSTERQALVRDGSLDTQESSLRNYLLSRSTPKQLWKVIDTYREEGRSGKDLERPELQRLLSDIRSGRINVVACTKIDRISRSLLDFYNLHRIFEEHGVEFISLDENFDTSSPAGRAMLKIALVFAELEREQTSVRTKDKMQWRAEQGLWNGGQLLGYDNTDEGLAPNEEEAALVRLMFDKYLELGSITSLVQFINDAGYRTKRYVSRRGKVHGGTKYYVTTVKQILQNPVYIGKIRYKGEIHPGRHQAIIDEELFRDVQRHLEVHTKPRRNFRRPMKHTFILQGLVRCGKCGSFMTTKYCTGSRGLRYYYQCTKNSHRGKAECDMRYVPAEELERLVIEKLRGISMDRKVIDEIVAKANQEGFGDIADLEKELKALKNQLKPINVQLENYLKAIGEGFGINKSTLFRMQNLEEQKAQLERRLEALTQQIDSIKRQRLNAQTMQESLTRFSQIIDVATPEEKKSLIPRIVESIVFTPDEVRIALYDRPIERGILQVNGVNQGSDHALEGSEWLPR